MSGFSTTNTEFLTRTNVWDSNLKMVLEDELQGIRYVDMLQGFTDGDTLNIPSIGQMEVRDYAEGQAVVYTAMDTGNFTFTITEYKSSATYIYEKFKQDSFYMSRLVSAFVPKMHRALMATVETDIMRVIPEGQTVSSVNAINSQDHRWVGGGPSQTMSVNDFAKALHVLKKANVQPVNLVAIVDPSVEFAINTLPNIGNMSNNPQWEGIVSTGIASGMRFIRNIYGFDVYTSNYLKSGLTDTISGRTVTTGVANLFFSAAPDVLPIVGSIRQPPKVDSEFNKDFQREEYITTMRYAFKWYRPENSVVVITDTNQVVS